MRRRAHLVARLDGGGEVRAESVLERSHAGRLWQPWGMPLIRVLSAASLGAGAAAGAGLTAYAAWEARQYTLRRVEVPLLPAGARPLRVLHLSDIHMTPGSAPQAGVAGRAGDAASPTWSSTPATTWRTPPRSRWCATRSVPLLDVPGVFVFGSNDYFSPTAPQPAALPAARRRPPQHPLREAALARPARRLHRGRLGRPHQPARGRQGRRAVLRLRRRRRPAPALRPARRRRRPGRPAGRRPAGRRARAVPPGARPVRRRRLRRDPGRPHPRRPGLPARRRRADHQLRPRARPRQGAAPPPGRLAGRRPGLHLAARLRRDRHLAVRPDPGGLPPEATLLTLVPGGPDRLGNAVRSGMLRPGEPRARA